MTWNHSVAQVGLGHAAVSLCLATITAVCHYAWPWGKLINDKEDSRV